MIKDKIPGFLLLIIVVLIGFLIGYVFSNREILFIENIGDNEKPSPFNHISEQDIHVSKDKVIIDVNEPRWATFKDSNSMDPVFDIGANTIQIVPKSEKDVHVGDIVSYRSRYSKGIIIHRVHDIDYDKKGWYMIAKGDNNFLKDPGKIRFDQIKSLTIAIIY